MNMFTTLIVVMASQVYAYVQIHQIVYLKYVPFFTYQFYLNQAVKYNKIFIIQFSSTTTY